MFSSLFPLKYFEFINSCWQNNYVEKPNYNEQPYGIQCKPKNKNNSLYLQLWIIQYTKM